MATNRMRAVAFWNELGNTFHSNECLERAEHLAGGEGDWFRGAGDAFQAVYAWAGANRQCQQEARETLTKLLEKYDLGLQ